MKKPILFLAACLLTTGVSAQVSSTAAAWLNVNNVRTLVLNATDLSLSGFLPHYYVPANGNKSTISAAALWIGGLDTNGNLHMAAMTYRQTGADFFPGPSGTKSPSMKAAPYDKIWSVRKTQIDSFKAGKFKVIPNDILTWPGTDTSSVYERHLVAPFVDKDHDRSYSTNNGDFPYIRGDRSLFYICNDDYDSHTESFSNPLGIDVTVTAYAFSDTAEAINNTTFFHYSIINHSSNNYHDLFAGIFCDPDIGDGFDDYIGSDSALGMYFGYNADSFDGGPMGYGKKIPSQAVVFLNKPMSRFISYRNDFTAQGNPSEPRHFYNLLKGSWIDGSPMYYGGDGVSGTRVAQYEFDGDPVMKTGWSEKKIGLNPGDRRGVGSCGPFNLRSKDTLLMDVAFVTAFDTTSSNYLTSITKLKKNVKQVRKFFDDQHFSNANVVTTGIGNENKLQVSVYPNPVESKLYINAGTGVDQIELFDLNGRLLYSDRLKGRNGIVEIDCSRLSRGIYILKATGETGIATTKVVKE